MNSIFRGKVQGAATMGVRGQIVIPAEVRESLRIKPGDKLIVIANDERKIIGPMRADDFNRLLRQVAKMIPHLEKKVFPKNR